ncbi:MAG TPA: transcriptional regulator [Geobacteraceae bacterium]|nr:transcriptional regulator [Geobacteraceae bacterium]
MKKQLAKKPHIPRADQETIRHAIIDLLRDQTLSALQISAEVHIPEKDVYGHLEHIRLSIHASGAVLQITPAECRRCGFLFTKRDRLHPPSRCPVCRHEAIFEPLFAIEQS